MLILDFIYISLIKSQFERQIIEIQKFAMVIRWPGVIACYMFVFFLFYWFIMRPKRTPEEAFLLGLCVYGIYDTTNYATLYKWNLNFACIDTIWGGVIFYTTTTIYNYLLTVKSYL